MSRRRPSAPVSIRRRALGLANVNAVLWSAGNALTTGSLVVFLALDLGANGVWTSAILALPALVGILRIGTPFLIRLLGTSRATCLAVYPLAYLVLLALPVPAIVAGGSGAGPVRPALAAMAAILCLHQLLEHMGSAALWNWLGELIPPPVRGRYLGRRQMLQLAALIPAITLGGWYADYWRQQRPEWLGVAYGVPITVGGLLLLAAVYPLWLMPSRLEDSRRGAPDRARSPAAARGGEAYGSKPPAAPRGAASRGAAGAASRLSDAWSLIIAPVATRPYRRLLLFGCWLSFFQGLTQSPQNIFPYAVLALGVLPLEGMRTGMRLGQLGLSPLVGRLVDRAGTLPVMFVCLAVTALGPLFYLAASPEQPWWIAGAWVAWSAYAGVNLGINNLMLKLAPPERRAGCVAGYLAWTSAVYALSTLAGGLALDDLRRLRSFQIGPLALDYFGYFFFVGFATRAMGLLLLLAIPEPGARGLRQILVDLGWLKPKPAAPLRTSPFSAVDV